MKKERTKRLNPPEKTRVAIVVAWLGIGSAFITAVASIAVVYLPIWERTRASKSAISVAPAVASSDWKYEEFLQTGGDGAAARLSEENEQPLPHEVYATAPAAKKFCVWWKPSRSGYTYRYAYTPWHKNNPTKVPIPALSPSQVPIGFGGKDYELFLFFDGITPR